MEGYTNRELKDGIFTMKDVRWNEILNLSSLSSDAAGKLNIFWHDSDTFRMNGAKVGIFKKTDKVSLRGLLKS